MREDFKRITQKDWISLSRGLVSWLCLDAARAGSSIHHHKLLFAQVTEVSECHLPYGAGKIFVSDSQ